MQTVLVMQCFICGVGERQAKLDAFFEAVAHPGSRSLCVAIASLQTQFTGQMQWGPCDLSRAGGGAQGLGFFDG